VIVLAEEGSQETLDEAVSSRSVVILRKNASSAELSIAIRRALELRRSDLTSALTTRQRQVLALIAAGLDNAQIAGRLGISTRTARAHVSGVLERLGVENRTQAAVRAVMTRLPAPDG
jgi:DNA-binding NarL/FixJ family response regulator